jgi:hypothetical protein
MAPDDHNKQLTAYGQAWSQLDADAVMALIAKEGLVYYESTFNEPRTSWDEVNALWQIVPSNQKDVTWWHESLLHDDNKVLAHVKVTRTMVPSGEVQDIDAAFLFGFNSDGKINYFRQWRTLG